MKHERLAQRLLRRDKTTVQRRRPKNNTRRVSLKRPPAHRRNHHKKPGQPSDKKADRKDIQKIQQHRIQIPHRLQVVTDYESGGYAWHH